MPSVVTAQTDFSAGEIDVEAKRDNKSPLTLAGARQLSNLRILNAKGVTNRPGRRALFLESTRVEEVLMAPGVIYYIAFPNADLHIYDSTGTLVFNDTARAWTAATAKDVVWAVLDKSIYITFGGQQPRVLTWDGATTWTAADYAETVTGGGQKRGPFYRLSPKGITMLPSAQSGAITLTFSAGFLVAGHVNTRMRYVDRQVNITAVTNPALANATVLETLPPGQQLTFATDPRVQFNAGEVVTGSASGSRGIVISTAALTIVVQVINNFGFVATDAVIGPRGSLVCTAVTPTPPQPITIWDDEVMNSFRQWPHSCFADQGRLGFCNFPALPSGISWSAVGLPNDLYVGANPTDAIFELAPNRSQVLYVVPGMDASEFVFCDQGLFYIPITPANPLKPGSVTFNTISEDACGAVQPRRTGEIILYAAGGLTDIMAVKIFGAYSRSYKTDHVTELSGHLFTGVTAIAVMTAASTFDERYAFVLNSDGSVVVGKYSLGKSNDLEGAIGWTPWTGAGTVKWVSCRGGNVLFTTSYAPNGIAAFQLVELLDDSRYLDASQLYNTQPSGLPIPVGKGPLWWMPLGSVDLMDGPLGTRMMGTYLIDADGFLIPQGNGGEDLTSVNLRVGQTWTARLERFVPPVADGQDVDQRMKARRLSEVEVYVKDSSGFLTQRLYSGQTGPLLPAPGTVMGERRISTWNQGEDPTQPPTLREQAYRFRPLGRSHDPRFVIVKDTPGPLTVLEINMKPTV